MSHDENDRLRPGGEDEPDRSRPATTDTVESLELARRRDPSLAKRAAVATEMAAGNAGVEWVRPSELLASRTAKLAGRGIDFHAELARRARQLPGTRHRGMRTLSERARRLPPVTAFGRSPQTPQGASRFGIGLR